MIDMRGVTSLLADTGYTGWIVVEDESPTAEDDPMSAADANGAFVDDLLRPPRRRNSMTAKIGVNTFVWYSPLTDDDLAVIVPRAAGWGFETIELVLENAGDWSPEARARTDLSTRHHRRPSRR